MYKNRFINILGISFDELNIITKHNFKTLGSLKWFQMTFLLIWHSLGKLLTGKKFKLVSSLASALFLALAGLVFQSSFMQAQATGTTTVFFKECDASVLVVVIMHHLVLVLLKVILLPLR